MSSVSSILSLCYAYMGIINALDMTWCSDL